MIRSIFHGGRKGMPCCGLILVFLLFGSCAYENKPPVQTPYISGITQGALRTFIPVTTKDRKGEWTGFYYPAESYIDYFPKDYFENRSEDLLVSAESVTLLEDSMNSYRAMRPYLVASGYDFGIEKEVFLRLQLNQNGDLWGLYPRQQNTLEVFLCEEPNPRFRVAYLPNGDIDGFIDPWTGKRGAVTQYVIEKDE